MQAAKTTIVKIQRKGGKVIQDCDVYIGRPMNRGGWHLKGSKWANPFKATKNVESHQSSVDKYRKYIMNNEKLLKDLPELKGKVLGCWVSVRLNLGSGS